MGRARSPSKVERAHVHFRVIVVFTSLVFRHNSRHPVRLEAGRPRSEVVAQLAPELVDLSARLGPHAVLEEGVCVGIQPRLEGGRGEVGREEEVD